MEIEVLTISAAGIQFPDGKKGSMLCLCFFKNNKDKGQEQIFLKEGTLERFLKIFHVESLKEIVGKEAIVLRRKKEILAIGLAKETERLWYYTPEQEFISLRTILKKCN